ncbi:MAG: hypothetical protein M3388_05765 [Acidobacteriota bacterium]|nr:hypothetical protein [Acidobacteriota bacterium]
MAALYVLKYYENVAGTVVGGVRGAYSGSRIRFGGKEIFVEITNSSVNFDPLS